MTGRPFRFSPSHMVTMLRMKDEMPMVNDDDGSEVEMSMSQAVESDDCGSKSKQQQ